MKILLLGATGRTGKLILQELLNLGHTVHAVVRQASQLQQREGLLVSEGNPTDEDILYKAAEGCDAIVSALNISRKSDFPWSKLRTPKDLLSATMKLLVKIGKEKNIKRIVVISAWGVGDSRMEIPFWFRWTIDGSNIRWAYEDHDRQEKILEHSEMNWTIVRPVGLTDGKHVRTVHTSINNHPRPKLLISRHNLARFVAGLAGSEEFFRQKPVVFE